MIYILEDDDSIRKLVTYALESQGVAAAGFAAPSAFYAAMEEQLPSLLLLDIMLPEEDGISILKKLRADPCTARIPVIMLTARGEEYDRVEGLDAGADDYVTKPFGMMELLARVRALLRRANMSGPAGLSGAAEAHAGSPGPEDPATDPRAVSGANPPTETLQTDRSGAGSVRRSEGALRSEGTRRNEGTFRSGGTRRSESTLRNEETLRSESALRNEGTLRSESALRNESGKVGKAPEKLHFGDLQIFPARYEVFVGEQPVALTKKEYLLLLLLARNEGIVLTREVLMDRIWDLGTEPENRTLDVHIRKVRTKLGEEGRRIETVRGVGYRFRG